MAEIKRTFTAARMNKDVDERLIQNGEYRDAMNIQIRTTDSDAAGTVQNIQGNAIAVTGYTSQGFYFSPEGVDGEKQNKCIGSIEDNQANKAYFFMAAPEFKVNFKEASTSETIGNDVLALSPTSAKVLHADSIVELTSDGVANFVIQDFYAIAGRQGAVGFNATSAGTNVINVGFGNNIGYIRVGSTVQFYDSSGNAQLPQGTKITALNLDDNNLGTVSLNNELSHAVLGGANAAFVKVENERVLNFNQKNLITGVNIVDEFLIFTDGVTEPKKVNIRRCRLGSPRDFDSFFALHATTAPTKLFLDNKLTGTAMPISDIQSGHADHLLEEHITVIRKAPRTAPNISMSKSPNGNNVDFNIVSSDITYLNSLEDIVPSSSENISGGITTLGNALVGLGSLFGISNTTEGNENFNASSYSISEGDVLILTSTNNVTSTPTEIRARIIQIISNGSEIVLQALNVSGEILINDIHWHALLEQEKPLFEFKFPRFGYRYKYNDGEYSSFSPFSEIAFLPGKYDFEPKRGFNLGMRNLLRELKITNFLPDKDIRPDDIDSVDILYKSTDSPVVYVIKTINRDIDPEWFGASGVTSNEVVITSDMVYKALPNNQILRSYDNVPRFARAQEVIGNRIVYANYTQGFNSNFNPAISVTLQEKTLDQFLAPEKSIKSLRNYKVGLVYGDKFGRETPVMSPGDRTLQKSTIQNGNVISVKGFRKISDSIAVSKEEAVTSNKLQVNQFWTDGLNDIEIPEWINYVKFYVKETSGEYYNMLQHRWYDAEDGNIWLAFGSVDRNKVTEEDYLVLKKQHGQDVFVPEDTRYKVLAIADQAPQFVKTVRTRIGEMTLAEVDQAWTADAQEHMAELTVFTMSNPFIAQGLVTSNMSNYFMEEYGVATPATDIFARIIARSFNPDGTENSKAATTYKKVIKIGGDYYGSDNTFEIEFSYGEEAHFKEYFLNIGDYDNHGFNSTAGDLGTNSETVGVTYEFEFKRFTVENKPEFDGRFFVKVAKDALLQRYVVGNALGDSSFGRLVKIPNGSFKVAYLNNNFKTNPATLGTYNSYDFGTSNTGSIYEKWVDESAHLYENIISNPATNFVSMKSQSYDNGDNVIEDNGLQHQIENMMYWFKWGKRSRYSMFIDAGDAFAVAQHSNSNWSTFQDEDQDLIDSMIDGGVGNTGLPEENPQPDIPEGTLANDTSFPCEGNRRGFAQSGTLSNDDIDRIYFGIHPAAELFSSQSEFSTQAGDHTNWMYLPLGSPEARFFHHMQTPGTMFRFVASPLTVFRVVGDDEINGGAAFDLSGTILNNYSFKHDLADQINNSAMNIVKVPSNSTATINNVIDEETDINSGNISSITQQDRRQNFYTTFRRINVATGETLNEGLDLSVFDPRGVVRHDGTKGIGIEIVDQTDVILEEDTVIGNGAVWETEPKESVDLDIYYEASNALPLTLNEKNTVEFAPIGSTIEVFNSNGTEQLTQFPTFNVNEFLADTSLNTVGTLPIRVGACFNSIIKIVDSSATPNLIKGFIKVGDIIEFTHPDGTVTKSKITRHIDASVESSGLIKELTPQANGLCFNASGYYEIDSDVHKQPVILNWSNCFTFGNGVESNRIRDDFNTPFIDNGVNASTTFFNYKQEDITNGFIFSGIYNSNSSVNNLNEFNMGEKITKEINPSYGSIQRLKARDTDLITFTEDKVLKVLANKDALFNADGNTNLTASDRVLGQAIPFVGEYGISKNPESLAVDKFRMYFTDQERGAVLRLSRDGLTPISDVGMRNYFRDNLPRCSNIIGSFDTVSGEYNVSLKFQPQFQQVDTTVSFNEAGKGWISFKSFVPDNALSMSGEYYTTSEANVYKHHVDVAFDGTPINRNTFYQKYNLFALTSGTFTKSHVDFVFNESPSSVKNFKAINYEGSQGFQFSINNASQDDIEDLGVTNWNDNSFATVTSTITSIPEIKGWKVSSITTDLQQGRVVDFSKKEGKWYGNIVGNFNTQLINGVPSGGGFNNVTITPDPSELSTQGLGVPGSTNLTYTNDLEGIYNLIIQ